MERGRSRSRGGGVASGFTPDPLLPNWTQALVDQNNGTKSPILLAIGDSTTFGSFSNGAVNSAGVDLNTNSYPAKLAGLFQTGGRETQQNALVANGFIGTTEVNSANDPSQTTLGAQWQRTNTTSLAVGGASLLHTSTTHTPNYYTSRKPSDTFRVWYAVDTGYGNLLYNMNGGSWTTISCNGTQASAFVDVPCGSVGTHTLGINTDIAGNVIILGVEGYNSTANQLKIRKAGWAASRTDMWLDTTREWSAGKNVASFNPDLIVGCLGINHWIFSEASRPLATFTSELASLIDYWKTISDVAIVTPTQSEDGTNTFGTIARQDSFVAAIQSTCASKNVKCIDWYTYSGGYVALNARGGMQNQSHPNAIGYAEKAAYIYSQIKVPTTYGV